MPYLELELSKTKFKHMLDEFIEEECTTEEFEKLILKLCRKLTEFDDCDFTSLKKLVDREYKLQKEYETDECGY